MTPCLHSGRKLGSPAANIGIVQSPRRDRLYLSCTSTAGSGVREGARVMMTRHRIASACVTAVAASVVIAPALPAAAVAYVGLVEAADSPYSVATNPVAIVTADFNGDGFPDIATSSVSPSRVSVLLGDGAAGFTAASGSPFVTGSGPSEILSGDFNDDGDLDIATLNDEPLTANRQGIPDTASVLLGDGTGNFAAPLSQAAGGPFQHAFAAGDLNQDGELDLLVSHSAFSEQGVDNKVDVLLGNGDGSFAFKSDIVDRELAGSVNPAGIGSIAVGDLNGDGSLDFVVANQNADGLSAWLGDGTGQFAAAPGSPVASAHAAFVLPVDLTEDGNLDLAVTSANFFTISVLAGDGTGQFATLSGYPVTLAHDVEAPAVADFDGDGHQDLAAPNLNHNSLDVWYGDGTGNLQLSSQSPISAGGGPRGVAPADYDGNGVTDLAAVSTGLSAVILLLGTVDSTPPTTSIVLDPDSPDGSNGWYRMAPTATVTATDTGGGSVQSTRCTVDPASAPTDWDDLPGSCVLPDGPVVGSEGSHVIYAASSDSAGNIGGVISRTVNLDGSGPTLDPVVTPDVIYQGSLATAAANATDPVSGIATQSCDAVSTDAIGAHSVQCSATDNAGNTTSAGVSYTVLAAADLSVAIDAAVSPRMRQITYTVTVSNGGPSVATNVVLTDTLPSGGHLVSTDFTEGTCTTSGRKTTAVSCTYPSLSAAAESVVTIVVRVSGKSRSFRNVATVASDTHELDDVDNQAMVDTVA